MIAEEVSIQVSIRPISVAVFLTAPNAVDLIRAYASECLVPDAEPQLAMYEAMEKLGMWKCFAAYINQPSPSFQGAADSRLIGFCSVLRAVVPHDGHWVATTESVFVDRDYRHTSAFDGLLVAAEQYATDSGCRILACGARVGSPLDKVLSRRAGYDRTHTQHTKWLGEFRPRLIEPKPEGQL